MSKTLEIRGAGGELIKRFDDTGRSNFITDDDSEVWNDLTDVLIKLDRPVVLGVDMAVTIDETRYIVVEKVSDDEYRVRPIRSY